jgi:hypothetical protein
VDDPAPSTAVPVELPLERPVGVLEDEPAAEFVPVLEESTPLPTRGLLPARGRSGASQPVEQPEVVEPVLEAAAAIEPVVPAEPAEALAVSEPAPLVAPDLVTPVVEDRVPSELDAEPVAEPVAGPVGESVPEAAPVLALEPDVTAPLSLVPDPEAVAQVEAPAVEVAVQTQAAPSAGLEEVGSQARSALSEFAREPQHVDATVETPVETPVETAPETAPEPAEPAPPAQPVVGAASMDILPTRTKGRGLRRKPAAAAPQAAPVRPPAAALTHRVPAARGPLEQRTASPSPVAGAPSMFAPHAGSPTEAAPFTPSPGAGEAQDDGPVPAPPSLFAAPRVAQEAPTPTPAIPALAAAQSLRERSAMASEALSELSSLSSYSPQTVEQAAPLSLTRRTPLATPAGQAGQAAQQAPEEPLGARRGSRNAADVRTMLSGFRAGVERGRTSPGSSVPLGDTNEH